MTKKRLVSEDELRDLWLKKYFNTDSKGVIEAIGIEAASSSNWFKLYQVTQEQYDEWRKDAKNLIKEVSKISKRLIDRGFWYIELQCGPMIKREGDNG